MAKKKKIDMSLKAGLKRSKKAFRQVTVGNFKRGIYVAKKLIPGVNFIDDLDIVPGSKKKRKK